MCRKRGRRDFPSQGKTKLPSANPFKKEKTLAPAEGGTHLSEERTDDDEKARRDIRRREVPGSRGRPDFLY